MILSKFQISTKLKIYRILWALTYNIFFRFSPVFFHGYRCNLLRLFGAKIGSSVHIYPSTRIWAPINLHIKSASCLGPNVDCYNVDLVSIGEDVVISQHSILCTASHDYDSNRFELVTAPIHVEDGVWVASYSFLAPGVTLKKSSVVLARSTVIKSIPPGAVVAGAPASIKKFRNQK